MRRYLLYLTISSLAFGIGIFTAFKFYRETVNQRLETQETNQNVKFSPTSQYQLSQVEEFKYGCKEKELEPFWETLDKEHFLKFMKQYVKIRNTDSSFTSVPDLERFENEWNEFQKNFGCTYFTGFDKEFDLNADGKNEIFIIGEYSGYKADSEMFVFQKQADVWRIILYSIANAENEIPKTKTNNYFDIKTETSNSGGSVGINVYKFDGKKYIEQDCFERSTVIDKGDEKIIVDNPVTFRRKCFQKFSHNLR